MRTPLLVLTGLAALLSGCIGYEARHEIQADSRSQVWLSEASQVKLRDAQSRVYETGDRRRILEAIVATFQDLGFQIEVLDDTLGVVSGKKLLDDERPGVGGLPTYLLYDEESLVVFGNVYRTWGPFQRRSDLVRLTATVRQRSEGQLVVRASAQYYLRAVEEPETYQKFYTALQQALFAQGTTLR